MNHEFVQTNDGIPPSEEDTEVKIPITLAFQIGTLLAVTKPYEKGDQQAKELAIKEKLAARFDACTDDMFTSDTNHLVPVTMSPADLELITRSAMTLSPGPDDEPSGAGDFRREQLRSVRSLQQRYRLGGGKVDPELKKSLDEELH